MSYHSHSMGAAIAGSILLATAPALANHDQVDTSGDVLHLSDDPAVSANEVQLRNDLDPGSIDAGIYKDGRLLAVQDEGSEADDSGGITGATNQNDAETFQDEPTIGIGMSGKGTF